MNFRWGKRFIGKQFQKSNLSNCGHKSSIWSNACSWCNKSFTNWSSIQMDKFPNDLQSDCDFNSAMFFHVGFIQNDHQSYHFQHYRLVRSHQKIKTVTWPQWFVLANFLFFAMNTLEYIGFIGLALKWPELMQKWEAAEVNLASFCNYSRNMRFVFKMRCIALTVLLLASGIDCCCFELIKMKLNFH